MPPKLQTQKHLARVAANLASALSAPGRATRDLDELLYKYASLGAIYTKAIATDMLESLASFDVHKARLAAARTGYGMVLQSHIGMDAASAYVAQMQALDTKFIDLLLALKSNGASASVEAAWSDLCAQHGAFVQSLKPEKLADAPQHVAYACQSLLDAAKAYKAKEYASSVTFFEQYYNTILGIADLLYEAFD